MAKLNHLYNTENVLFASESSGGQIPPPELPPPLEPPIFKPIISHTRAYP